jgi:uncharacterized protein
MGVTLVGAGYRPELHDLFAGDGDAPPAVDCAELIANRYFATDAVARPWELAALGGLPLVVHGLSGNVASASGPDAVYLGHIKQLADFTGALAYSDHLAFTAAGDHSLGHLAPNRFDDELLELSARHIEKMGRLTNRRVCLENLATKTMVTGSRYTPEEFYLRLLEISEEWDCLFDLTNVWINSQNRPVDPIAVIDAIPPSRLRYIHLAGGQWNHGELVDSHSHAVHPEAFELLAYVLERADPEVIIIERDSNFQGAEDEMRADLATVRNLLASRSRRREQSSVVGRRQRSRTRVSSAPASAATAPTAPASAARVSSAPASAAPASAAPASAAPASADRQAEVAHAGRRAAG